MHHIKMPIEMNSFMQNLEPAKQFADPTQPKIANSPKEGSKYW